MFIATTATTATSNINIHISWIVTLLTLLSKWFVLEKMGEKGWKCLIPFYGEYLICKHVWDGKIFWMQLLTATLGVVALVTSVILLFTMDAWYVFAALATGIFLLLMNLVISFKLTHRLAKAFGHGVGFTIGLILLNPLFMLVLGLDNREVFQA